MALYGIVKNENDKRAKIIRKLLTVKPMQNFQSEYLTIYIVTVQHSIQETF